MMLPELPTILIVDDIPSNIELLAEILQDEYNILFAINGEDGIEIAIEQQPDLILLDVMMPGSDGYEVCKRLKSDPSTRNIPVIFLTAMATKQDEYYGLEIGAIDYIRKPYSIPIIKARVKNHIELKRRGDLLEKLATLDGLTGIPNRRRFDEFLKYEWLRAKRYGLYMSMLMIDIDHFKLYNDVYGHLAGDDCLKRVARVIKNSVKRSVDLVARYGGEEFACILTDTDNQAAITVSKEILSNIKKLAIPHKASKVSSHLTLSIGVSTMIPHGESSPDELIQSADRLLYAAKLEGRNRVKGME